MFSVLAGRVHRDSTWLFSSVSPQTQNTVSFFWKRLVVHAWTSDPYAKVWNLKVFNIVEELKIGEYVRNEKVVR